MADTAFDLLASPGEPAPEQHYTCSCCERDFQGPSGISWERRCPRCGSPPPFAVRLGLQPACAKSSASLALSAPTQIPLEPAVARSAASLTLRTRSTPSAYAGSAITIAPSTAAEIHRHPQAHGTAVLDATMVMTVAFVAVRRRL
jgi:hypothetical protein